MCRTSARCRPRSEHRLHPAASPPASSTRIPLPDLRRTCHSPCSRVAAPHPPTEAGGRPPGAGGEATSGHQAIRRHHRPNRARTGPDRAAAAATGATTTQPTALGHMSVTPPPDARQRTDASRARASPPPELRGPRRPSPKGGEEPRRRRRPALPGGARER